jgi:hypothetical protein
MNDYLIWSNEHEGWWGPGRIGYARRIENAGRYSHAEALDIRTNAMPGRRGHFPLNEIPVRLGEVQFMLGRFDSRFPGHDPEPQE